MRRIAGVLAIAALLIALGACSPAESPPASLTAVEAVLCRDVPIAVAIPGQVRAAVDAARSGRLDEMARAAAAARAAGERIVADLRSLEPDIPQTDPRRAIALHLVSLAIFGQQSAAFFQSGEIPTVASVDQVTSGLPLIDQETARLSEALTVNGLVC